MAVRSLNVRLLMDSAGYIGRYMYDKLVTEVAVPAYKEMDNHDG